ncbi:MAG: hypothetical protein AAGE52_16090 [Myxococcota bacterium]
MIFPDVNPVSILVLGITPRADDMTVLAELLGTEPEALWLDIDRVAIVRQETELESVIFAECIRTRAARKGIRMAIGIAERHEVETPLSSTLNRAREAFDFAVGLGSDLTVSYSSIVRSREAA